MQYMQNVVGGPENSWILCFHDEENKEMEKENGKKTFWNLFTLQLQLNHVHKGLILIKKCFINK